MTEQQHAAFLADYGQLPAEDQEAVRRYIKRLAQICRDTPDLSPAERRGLLVEVAREVGNAHLIDAAERTAGRNA